MLNCSDVTAAAVDEEVRKIMEDCYKEAKAILSENMEAMDLIAEQLIREETITGKDFMRLYRQAKGLPEEEPKDKDDKDTAAEAPALEAKAPKSIAAPAAPENSENTAAPAEAGISENAAAPEEEPKDSANASEDTVSEESVSEADSSDEDGSEEDGTDEDAPKDSGRRGRFTDVPQKDVDRFFNQ